MTLINSHGFGLPNLDLVGFDISFIASLKFGSEEVKKIGGLSDAIVKL